MCHVLDSSLVYPSICLGCIREQIDPVPLSVYSVSLLPLLESEKPREFKLDKCLNACADCPGSSAGKKENICVGSKYFETAVQLLNLFQKSKHCKII